MRAPLSFLPPLLVFVAAGAALLAPPAKFAHDEPPVLTLPDLAPVLAPAARLPSPHLARGAPLPAAPLRNLTFNWTLTDMDTILQYTPFTGDGGSDTWINSFSGSAAPPRGASVVGRGASTHSTALTAAYVALDFVGSGVYFMGGGGPGGAAARVRLTVDGANADFEPPKLTPPLLAFADKLPFGAHRAVFTLLEGSVSLANVIVQSTVLSRAPSLDASRRTETLILDAFTTPTRGLTFAGDWHPVSAIGGDASTAPVPYSAVNGSPGASLAYTVPANTSFLYVNGSSQPSPAMYSARLSPPPPGGVQLQFSALRTFCNGVNLFMAPLDPAVQYTLNFTVTPGLYSVVGVHSITTFSSEWSNSTDVGPPGDTSTPGPGGADGTSPASRHSIATIVGAVIGGVVGITAVAGIIFCICLMRRRKNEKRTPPRPDMFVVDEEPHAVTPFVVPAHRSPAASARSEPASSTEDIAPLAPLPPAGRCARRVLDVRNPDAVAGLEMNLRDPAAASHNIAQQKRAAARASTFDAEFGMQETDAGPMQTVPPSYDPSWAGDYPLSEPEPSSGDNRRLSRTSAGI